MQLPSTMKSFLQSFFGGLVICAGALLVTANANGQGQVVGWGDSSKGQALSSTRSILGFKDAAAGTYHTVAIRADGSVMAWGLNSSGQTTVPATLGRIVQVAAGNAHTMALSTDGKVTAWGANLSGQRTVPTNLGTVMQIAAGYEHSMALQTTGKVRCWGNNNSGQCTVPTGLAGVTQIASGFDHNIALKSNGTISVWGNNDYDQASVPIGLGVVTQVACGGYHNMALQANGIVVAWGDNSNQQCDVPASVGAVRTISAGAGHSLVVRVDGSCICWGDNFTGQCSVPAGIGAVSKLLGGGNHTVAVCKDGSIVMWGWNAWGQITQPSSELNVVAVRAGYEHTVVLTNLGGVRCWGANDYSQCAVPSGLAGVVAVSAGSRHTMALGSNGAVTCWGNNDAGQCTVPSNIGFISRIAAGSSSCVALRTSGTVTCWGWNANGQCTVPGSLSGVADVAAGVAHSIALRSNGTVTCWGAGLTTTGDIFNMGQSIVPNGLTNVTQVAGGGIHTIAMKLDGTVVCWGNNTYGQCTVPNGLSGVIQIAAGDYFSMALKGNGQVVMWGSNDYQQRVPPTGLTGVVQIAGGGKHAVALLDSAQSSCGGSTGSGSALLKISGGTWQDLGAWQWTNSGPRVPGAQSNVNLGTYGSVGSECNATAGTFTAGAGTSLLVTAGASQLGNDYSVRVSTTATMAGRLWLLGAAGGASTLPDNFNVPVLSCATANGFFDVIQTDVPPPAGKFLTVIPENVNGRTVFSLRLLPMPSAANLSSTTGASASGVAIAAESMDFNNDGFDDIALAVQTGSTGLVQVLMNDGLGNLGATSILKALPATPTALAVGDFSGDGTRNDVVVGLTDGTVRVYINNGSGFTAGAVVTLPTGEIAKCVCEVKPNGANRFMVTSSDFAVGTSASKLRTFGSSGGAGQIIPLSSVPRTVHSSDIDDDDLTDVTAAGSTSAASLTGALAATPTGFLQVVRGTTNGFNAETPFEILGEPVSMQIADIDGDGLPDIVTANRNPQSGGAGSLPPVFALFRNNGGTASFAGATPIAPTGASGGLDLALVDVNSDGVKDVVAVYNTVGTSSQAALININTLGAGYPLSIGDSTVISNNNPTLVAKGNLDGNGSEDVFLVQQASPFAASGDSTVAPFLGAQSAPCFGDLDGSGEVDSSDVSLCLLDYGICEGCQTDLDGSGEVDSSDVSLVLLSTGPCN